MRNGEERGRERQVVVRQGMYQIHVGNNKHRIVVQPILGESILLTMADLVVERRAMH